MGHERKRALSPSNREIPIEVAGILYSLIHTAKLQGFDPGDYLRKVAQAAIAEQGAVTLPSGLRA